MSSDVRNIGVIATAAKQPNEVWLPWNLGVDFSRCLVTGDAIASVTVAVYDSSGVDHAATMSTTQVVDSPKVGAGLQGGRDGELYTVMFRATTNLGGVYEAEILVPVAELDYIR